MMINVGIKCLVLEKKHGDFLVLNRTISIQKELRKKRISHFTRKTSSIRWKSHKNFEHKKASTLSTMQFFIDFLIIYYEIAVKVIYDAMMYTIFCSFFSFCFSRFLF